MFRGILLAAPFVLLFLLEVGLRVAGVGEDLIWDSPYVQFAEGHRFFPEWDHQVESGVAGVKLTQARSLIDAAIANEQALGEKLEAGGERNYLAVIADAAVKAFDEGETDEAFMESQTRGIEDADDYRAIVTGYRAKLIEQRRWPWAEICPGSNGSPRPVPIET